MTNNKTMDDLLNESGPSQTPAERLRMVCKMWKSARTLLRGAVRTEHPNWDDNQVNREIAKRISRGVVDR